jgi:pilus assembly protein CpaC
MKLFFFKVAICAATLLTLSVSAVAENINLTVGQKFTWPIQNGETAHLKGSHLVRLTDHGQSLDITALAPGSASVSAGPKTLKIFISAESGQNLYLALKKRAQGFLDLSVQMIAGQIVVAGQLHRIEDWQELAYEAKAFKANYIFAAHIDDDLKPAAQKLLRHVVASESLPAPNFLFAPEVRAVISEDYKNLAPVWDSLLAPYGIARTYEKTDFAIKPLVRVNIVVAEVNKSEGQQIGIEWPESVDARLTDKFSGPAQVLVTMHALERAGLGNILASPNLLARSGAEAEFLAGGELPIRVSNHYVHDVVWKRHGIYLKIKPTADFYGRVSIELTTEVSLPDKVYDDIPSLKTDRMSTHFDLAEPRTIVLSGLIRNNWDENTAGLPWLSRIPILGRLFSSKSYSAQRSELVVFVTPEIVKPQDENAVVKMPKGWRENEL